MGTAGLDVQRLAGLLERLKVDCSIVDGDEAEDHCVLRLSSVTCPGLLAFIEYMNQGAEPRRARLLVTPEAKEIENKQPLLNIEEWLDLSGPRSDDPEKIVRFVKQNFLKY